MDVVDERLKAERWSGDAGQDGLPLTAILLGLGCTLALTSTSLSLSRRQPSCWFHAATQCPGALVQYSV